MKKFFVIVLSTLLFICIGFGFPYLVQSKLNFLGATFVTMKDIGGLWIDSILIGVVATYIVFNSLISNKKK